MISATRGLVPSTPRATAPSIPRSTRPSGGTVRRFVKRELMPYVDQWDEAEEFPRELYRKASAAGLLQLGFPEDYGGVPTDPFFGIIKAEEMARHGSGGLNASLMSHAIGSPPIAALGPEWMKRQVLPEVLAGEKISALAITEPSGGSDVANLKTTAQREGDHYVVNGSKMFITSGMRADYFTVAVRTGGPGVGRLAAADRARPRRAFTAPSSRRWAGGRPTPPSSSSTTCRCRSRT